MEKGSFDSSTVTYLRQADATLRNGFEDEAIKEVFLDNVFEEIKGSEAKLSMMKSASFVMEQFVSIASLNNILQVLKAYSINFEEVSYSQQGCHVLQNALHRMLCLMDSGSYKSKDNLWKEVFSVVLDSCVFMTNVSDLARWMTDTHGTYVVRSLLEMLGGIITPLRSKKHQPHERKLPDEIIIAKKKLPDEFLSMFEKVFFTFSQMEKKQVVEILVHPSGTPCVCVMLHVASVQSGDTLQVLCEKIISSCQGNNFSTLTILAKDRTGSHVLESLLDSGHSETCKKIYEIFCSDHSQLIEYACHPVVNYVVQKLIVCPALEEKYEELFHLLLQGIEDIFAENKFGVVQKLAEQCVKLGKCQSKFVSRLLEAFQCKEEERKVYLVPLIASFSTYDAFFSASENNNKVPNLKNVLYHGSLLLQTLLKFNNPVAIVKSLTGLPAEHLVKLCCDVAGSHFIDAFFSSPIVKLKRKRLWLENVKDHLQTICCDKYGSRVMDNLWKKATMKMKIIIVENLVNNESDLSSNQYGKHITRKFGIKQFGQRRADWDDFQIRQTKKRKNFEEVFSSRTEGGKKKQKTKTS
ncbi:unnamed protein product [Clavelina lepadiformis]|uniref:Nucleolar protein 9 n=1 Tax=Clavelina lepadiformis TaxID=159417 RepID=A0ABP0F1H0_CLALP